MAMVAGGMQLTIARDIKCLPPAELEGHLLGLDLMDDAGVAGYPSERCVDVPIAAGQEAVTARPDAVQRVPRLPSGKIIIILHLANATRPVPMAVNVWYVIHLERQYAHCRAHRRGCPSYW
ncbi:hypothetical protein B0H19DRAFT_1258507 [Mycena capillaripes]|nr:hypothetical protein B0H19DRAFT_1258507 [Mycena capillaripes]